MSYKKQRKPRSYVYRIPLDDRAAMIRLRRFERKEEYFIRELKDSEVPNRNAVKNWAVVFYESKEHRDFTTDEMVGGVIPGLEEYRHSLDWKPHPDTELLEMKYHKGGSKIRGEAFVGTHDSRLSDYVPIDLAVPWTPKEIRAIWNGDPVPHPHWSRESAKEIPASEAMDFWYEELEMAKREGFDRMQEQLYELEDNCPHSHVIETGKSYLAGYCEDCGRSWEDGMELEYEIENGEAVVVGAE